MLPLDSIKDTLQPLLDKNLVSGRILLDRLRVIDETSRKSAVYSDGRYSGFYYHLGKIISPKSMLEIGFNLGILSCCFLKSCKTVKQYFGFQEKKEEFYSPSLGVANLHDNYKEFAHIYVGKITDEEFVDKLSPNSLDLIILNEEVSFDKHLLYLDFAWPYLSEYGIIVAEYTNRHNPARDAFNAFCGSKNRIPVKFATRYGTALVQK